MRRPLSDALVAAQAVVDLLSPGCERIEVAGSVRRRAGTVKDIEIVAVPAFADDLFGSEGADLLNQALVVAHRQGVLICRDVRGDRQVKGIYSFDGRRYYPLLLTPGYGDSWPVDLFVVRPPAQWGAVFAIRTGPADYSARLVTSCQRCGLRCTESHLVDGEGRTVDTPEEADFIRECGLPFLPPEQRR